MCALPIYGSEVLIFPTRSCRVPRVARCIEARADLGNQRSRWKVARGPSIHFGWRRNTRDERGRGFDLLHPFMPGATHSAVYRGTRQSGKSAFAVEGGSRSLDTFRLAPKQDRKSDVSGKSVYVSVDLGGRRSHKKKQTPRRA